MNRHIAVLTLMVYLVLAMGSGGLVRVAHAQDLAYEIGPGDVLHISVWKNEDLTRQVVVLPDGRIHFPLVKELAAAGKSVKDLEKMLSVLKARGIDAKSDTKMRDIATKLGVKPETVALELELD